MNRPRLQTMELGPSRRLALVLLVAHLAVLFVLATLPVTPWLQTGGSVLLVLSAVHAIAQHALRRGRSSVIALQFADREQLRVLTRDGIWHAGRILGSSTVGAALIVLNIRLDDRRRRLHVVIPGDSLDAQDFRRLRVWLRWGPRPLADEAAAL